MVLAHVAAAEAAEMPAEQHTDAAEQCVGRAHAQRCPRRQVCAALSVQVTEPRWGMLSAAQAPAVWPALWVPVWAGAAFQSCSLFSSTVVNR